MNINTYLGRYILSPFKVLAVANVSVTVAPASIDSQALTAGDRVFLSGQSTASDNGGWVFVSAGAAMTRAEDLAVGATIKSGTVFFCNAGTVYGDKLIVIFATSDIPIIIGTTAFSITTVSGNIFSTGLTDASGVVTANLSTGIAGGQTATGGVAASENLTLRSTSHATKGFTYIGGTTIVAVDEVNTRTGFGIASPTATVHAKGIGATNATYSLKAQDSGSNINFSVRDNGEVNSLLGYWIGGTKQFYSAGGINNVFIGPTSGNLTLSGTTNFGFGQNVLVALTTGTGNIALGESSMNKATIAGYNIALGGYSLWENISSNHNLALGYGALQNLASGVGENVGVGAYTGQNNTAGVQNVYAGYATGNSLTTGSYNIIIGNRAVSGSSYAGGNFNTVIGSLATINTGISFAIVLGAYTGDADVISNSFSCGTTSGGAIVSDVSFGAGYQSETTFNSTFTLHSTHVKAGQTDQANTGSVVLAGGKGTGTGAGANVLFQVALPGSTGTAQNAFVTRMTLSGTTGCLNFAANTTAGAQFNLAVSSAPASPIDGDFWREDNTNTGLKVRINGVTKTITVS